MTPEISTMPSLDETAAATAKFFSQNDLFARHLGIKLEELKPGYCRASLTLAPYMVNGHGIPHGAVIFALADYAFAGAGNSYGRTTVALNVDIHFLTSAGPNVSLTAETLEVKRGHRICLYRTTVTDGEGQLIAELHGTGYIKDSYFLEKNSS